jgi:uncharacterized membrane protein YhhN
MERKGMASGIFFFNAVWKLLGELVIPVCLKIIILKIFFI